MLYSWENTTRQVREAAPAVALLPVAAMEPHGDHLPVGSKVIILDVIARLLAEQLPDAVYLLPTLPMGTSDLHMGSSGAIALSWQTMTAAVRDLVESLLCQGIHRVVVLPGLGLASAGRVRPSENYVIKTAVRQLNYDHPDLQAIWVQPLSVAAEQLKAIFETAEAEVQAGEVVTSLMLHLAPGLVKPQATDNVPGAPRQYLDYARFEAICPEGVWGYPSKASAEKGARALDAAVHSTVSYVTNSFEHLARMKLSYTY